MTINNFSYIFLLLSIYAPVAQLVEQLPFKEMVEGSSPSGRTLRQAQCEQIKMESALVVLSIFIALEDLNMEGVGKR